jgi:hypothetical protein
MHAAGAASSIRIIAAVLALYFGWEVLLPDRTNPFGPFVKISYPMPLTPEDRAHAPAAEARPLAKIMGDQRYGKGPLDLCFLAFYVVVFSFIRQSSTEYFWRRLARKLGIRGEKKMLRFMEQGYALEYFSVFGALGVVRSRFFLRCVCLLYIEIASPPNSSSCRHNRPGGTKPGNSGSAIPTGACCPNSRLTTYFNWPTGYSKCWSWSLD